MSVGSMPHAHTKNTNCRFSADPKSMYLLYIILDSGKKLSVGRFASLGEHHQLLLLHLFSPRLCSAHTSLCSKK